MTIRPAERDRGIERGSASVVVLSLVSLLALLLVAVGGVAAVTVVRHRAAAAADLAALAAAGAPVTTDPCAEARRVARANAGELVDCRLLADGSVLVEVRPGNHVPRIAASLRIRARAGPLSAPGPSAAAKRYDCATAP